MVPGNAIAAIGEVAQTAGIKDASLQLSPALPSDAKDEEMKEEASTPIEETQEESAVEEAGDAAAAGDAVAPTEQLEMKSAAAEVAAAAPAAVEEAQCLICYDDLSNKRAVTCVPCMHSMHRTCALAWLESRTESGTQTCCNCRASVQMIADMETGEELEKVKAYGIAGQPTRALIDDVFYYSQNIADELREETEKAFLLLSKLAEQQRTARMTGRSESYITDFDEESTKLQQRLSILEQIEAEWALMRMAQLDRDHAAAAAAHAAYAAAQAAASAAGAVAVAAAPAAPAAPDAAAAAVAAAPQEDAGDESSLEKTAIEMDVAVVTQDQKESLQDEIMEVEERTVQQPTAATAAAADVTIRADEEEMDNCTNYWMCFNFNVCNRMKQ